MENKIHEIQPKVAIVASVVSIIFFSIALYSMHLNIKHTNLLLAKLDKE